MKTFEIRVTQDLSGYYEGVLIIEASNKKAALNKAKKMSKDDIDNSVNWSHGDEYDGDKSSIVIHEDSIDEI